MKRRIEAFITELHRYSESVEFVERRLAAVSSWLGTRLDSETISGVTQFHTDMLTAVMVEGTKRGRIILHPKPLVGVGWEGHTSPFRGLHLEVIYEYTLKFPRSIAFIGSEDYRSSLLSVLFAHSREEMQVIAGQTQDIAKQNAKVGSLTISPESGIVRASRDRHGWITIDTHYPLSHPYESRGLPPLVAWVQARSTRH